VGPCVGSTQKHVAEHGGVWIPHLRAAAVERVENQLALLKGQVWAVGSVRGEKKCGVTPGFHLSPSWSGDAVCAWAEEWYC